jgi:hypothetical protein
LSGCIDRTIQKGHCGAKVVSREDGGGIDKHAMLRL